MFLESIDMWLAQRATTGTCKYVTVQIALCADFTPSVVLLRATVDSQLRFSMCGRLIKVTPSALNNGTWAHTKQWGFV